MINKEAKSEIRQKKHARLRHYISGTTERPRLCVFRSNNHMYAQIIDDTVGKTLCAASTVEKAAKDLEYTDNVEAAQFVGKLVAERALEKGINKEKVGQYAAEIRTKRPPEPYKGKGIKYENETIIRKVGKTGK